MAATATETAAPAVDTQWICDPTRVNPCPCDGGEYSCSCDRDVRSGTCANCRAPMIEIEVDSGEPIKPKAVA
jgi:hypothetical protein